MASPLFPAYSSNPKSLTVRVGRIAAIIPTKNIGFIKADEFREDVFFHFSCVAQPDKPAFWIAGQEVEFELDELLRMDTKQLRANLVRAARRPLSHVLDQTADRRMVAQHHPRARQRKPTWRNRSSPPSDEPES